ncbi:MAG: glutathione S-transferase [Sphingobium sp.]|nr:glutathione S-transferase [Sphingobium sp.]
MSQQRTADYDFYYWQLPFRGQFIRAILAFAGKSWDEHDDDEIAALISGAPGDQPLPFMGPPLLIDRNADLVLSEMPAIALYLGETLALIPDAPAARAMTLKVVNDANDVIDELTLDGGREMWTGDKWKSFVPRLARWMTIWEVLGARHGLAQDHGFLLGGEEPGVADIVTSTLWMTMSDRFPAIAALLDETAPHVAALSRRIQALPPLEKLSKAAFETYGDGYCGGQIEKSLRSVAG